MSKKMLKCFGCDDQINIGVDHNYVLYSGKHYHNDCFVRKQTAMVRNTWTVQQCAAYIESQKEERAKEAELACVKYEFYQWLMEFYSMSVIPTYFYNKIADIFAGRYKNLNRSIPVEDIFDMWKRKVNYLDKTYLKNKSNGKDMDAAQRLNYDLAILLNKYDSYLAWKEEARAAQIEAAERVKERIETKYSLPVQPKPQTDGVNIYSILDEV